MKCDLNVNTKSNKDRERLTLLKRLIELGWDAVAWNTSAVGKVNPNMHKPPSKVDLEPASKVEALKHRSLTGSSTSSSSAAALHQYTRITLIVDEVNDASAITVGNEALRAFDVVAICPGNAKVFNYACETAEVDIISLDFSHRIPYSISKKQLDTAIARGVFFEIKYSLMVSAANHRKDVLAGCKLLVQYLRGRNIILSSGAESYLNLRGPADVENIGAVLSLRPELSQKAIGENCQRLLKHAYARRLRYIPADIIEHSKFKERYPGTLAYLDTHQGSAPLLAAESKANNDSIQPSVQVELGIGSKRMRSVEHEIEGSKGDEIESGTVVVSASKLAKRSSKSPLASTSNSTQCRQDRHGEDLTAPSIHSAVSKSDQAEKEGNEDLDPDDGGFLRF